MKNLITTSLCYRHGIYYIVNIIYNWLYCIKFSKNKIKEYIVKKNIFLLLFVEFLKLSRKFNSILENIKFYRFQEKIFNKDKKKNLCISLKVNRKEYTYT